MPLDPAGRTWVVTRRALAAVAADAEARAALAAGRVFEVLPSGTRPCGLVPSVPAAAFASASAMSGAAGAGELPEDLGVLVYDPEHWAFTPLAEQLDLGRSVARAARTAADLGVLLVAAPAVTLTKVLAPDFRGDRYDAYLAAGIAREAAAASVVCLQAQNAVRETRRYAAFVRAGRDQVKEVNPAASVIAGLSTNPPGDPVDAGMLSRAIEATAGLVEGWWLNVPSPGPRCPTCNPPRPDVGVAALRSVFARVG